MEINLYYLDKLYEDVSVEQQMLMNSIKQNNNLGKGDIISDEEKKNVQKKQKQISLLTTLLLNIIKVKNFYNK